METLNLWKTYNKFFSKETAISLVSNGNLPEEDKTKEINLILSCWLTSQLSETQYAVLVRSNPDDDALFQLASTVIKEIFGSILSSFSVEMQYQIVVAKYLEMTGWVICDNKKDIQDILEEFEVDPLGR